MLAARVTYGLIAATFVLVGAMLIIEPATDVRDLLAAMTPVLLLITPVWYLYRGDYTAWTGRHVEARKWAPRFAGLACFGAALQLSTIFYKPEWAIRTVLWLNHNWPM